MKYNIVYYKDIQKSDWDAYVKQMPDAGHQHSWSVINYFSKFSNVKENLSFAYLDEDKSVLAICPLAVSYNQTGMYFEMSFGGNPCAVPLIADTRPSVRRKILDELFNQILSFSQQFDVIKISMIWDPLVKHFCSDHSFHRNNFELLRYQMHYYVENVIVVCLDVPEEILVTNMYGDRKRNIKKTEKKGVTIEVFNASNNYTEAKKYFDLFQAAHFKSAGRMTRPQETWDAMFDCLSAGDASLFIVFVGEIPISYLYCGEFESMAFSWSQVNDDEYESEYSPRHLLEWKAMMFYKKHNFKHYEIGERYFGTQFLYTATEKEISISAFKEKFGGRMFPKIRWTGYLDHQLLKDDYQKRLEKLLESMPMVRIPAE